MKILIAGDIHGNLSHLAYLYSKAMEEGIDRIFQLGDFGFWEHMPEGVKFLDEANRHAYHAGVTLYFLDGNHDKTSLLLDRYTERDDEGFIIVREHIRYAPRGHRWTWGQTRFAAFGGAYSVDKAWRLDLEHQQDAPEALWFPEEEMSDEDMARFLTNTDPVDIILAHDKPRASNPQWNRKAIVECHPNQNRLQMAVRALKPGLFVHGHLHVRYTDTIMSGDERHFTRVEGLHCDPEATMHWPYDPAESWIILDTGEST